MNSEANPKNNNKKKITLPLHLVIMDGFGAILIALGLADLFGEFNIIPDTLKFHNYEIVMIFTGIALMLPFIIHIIRSVQGRGPREI